MDTRSLCQLCLLMVIVFCGVTEAVWTLTGSSEFAVAGESFTLTCNPQDSNAVAIKWRRLDIDTTTTAIATIEADRCKVSQGSDTQYQYTCEPGPVYKLTIPANVMTNSQNNIVWRCEFLFSSAGANYTVTVAVPVSSISLQESPSGNQQVNVIPVYENKQKTIYCITTGCRPKSNVTVTTTGVIKGQFTEDFIPQNGDLIITRVSQVITTTRGGSTTKMIQCSAGNIQGRQPVISQLATIVVYYIPSVEPTLTGYTTGTILYEGDKDITLTCQQSGGYPLSVITWACDGQTGTTNNSQTVASSYVRLAVNKNLNGRTCTCTVRHLDNNLAYTRTLSVTFIVYYPPTTPTLQTSGASFPWIEKTQGVLKCVTTSGFPTAITYEWIQNGQVINGQTSETFTIPTMSYIHNGLQIQCRVSNGYATQRPPAIISNTLILDVQYTPIITLDTTNVTIQEGSSRSRQCSAIGNPTPTVKWYRGNSVQTSGTGTSATLVFSNIDRNQTDTYICRATSTGIRTFVSSKSVSVIVYSRPEPPKNIGVFATEYSSISLKWERGFDGGYSQIFVILVQDMLSDSVREIFVKDDEIISNFSMTIYDLLPFTSYQINIFSMNENGNSSYLSVLALVSDALKECNSEVSNTPVIALSVVIVILVVVFVIIIIVVWRRGHNSPITGQRKSEGKPQIATHYEDISQTNQETSVYEGINTDHKNQNKSGVDTYEGLGSTTSAEIQNTYQSLEKTESSGSEGISIELYENTKIN